MSITTIAEEFARTTILPRAPVWEKSRAMATAEIREAINAGIGSIRIGAEYGGLGLDYSSTGAVLRILASADFAFAFSLAVHSAVAGSISEHGTPAQIGRYLRSVQSGERILSVCITEPSAGSDAAAMRTTAMPDKGGWRISGSKAWITNATSADLFLVYAQTESGAGPAGIAAFLIERKCPGLSITAPYDLVGCHSMGLAGIELADCFVPHEALFARPGDGFKRAMSGIDVARTLVSAMCCGMMEASLAFAIEATAERSAFGSRTIDFQGVQWMLADVATDLSASELLFKAAASKLDRGERATIDAAHAKKFSTKVALNAVAQCMQLSGARGLLAETAISRHLAGAKAAQYLDGTTEIQNVVIARSLRSRVNQAS
ncbi:acyl-CoA dehydrogenase family protein [Bradyrhizobium sp. RT3a]|uniref:acyl-CoA dehydrogenase family protein n=1 Tax=unclassified Bradyrhizobium TaxID=2631580 RepID=UPI003393F25C